MKTVTHDEISQPIADIAILSAVQVELDAIIKALKPIPEKAAVFKVMWDESVYYLGIVGSYVCVVATCAKGSIGRDGSILSATGLIHRWSPRALLLVGIAFGRGQDRDQVLGDVLVSTEICPYEAQRVGVSDTRRRSSIPEASLPLLNRAKSLDFTWKTQSGEKRRAILGPILSGEKVVDNMAFRDSIFNRFPDAIGGEMEGVGVFSAAARYGVPCMIVKAVCDWADGSKSDKAQPLAAQNAVRFVNKLLSEPGLDSLPRPILALPNDREEKPLSAGEFVLEDLRKDARRAKDKRQSSGEAVQSFLSQHLEGGQPVVPENLRIFFDTLIAKHKEDVENWLNVYEDASGHLIRGNLSWEGFRSTFGQEIVELCEIDGPQRERLNPRGASQYKNIWNAYDRLCAARRLEKQSLLKKHVLFVLRDYKIERPEHVPGLCGLVEMVKQRLGPTLSGDLDDEIKSAYAELIARGSLHGFDLTRKGWDEVDELDV